jgi:hypothetical protein
MGQGLGVSETAAASPAAGEIGALAAELCALVKYIRRMPPIAENDGCALSANQR